MAAVKNLGILIGLLVCSLALAQALTLSSPAFKSGEVLPNPFGCGGHNPPLRFANLPKGTQALAILGWDESKSGLASTWVLYDIPAQTQSLPAGLTNEITLKHGKNSQGKLGYSLACPAKGDTSHRYYFDFYALKVSSLGLPDGASYQTVHAAIKKYRIQEAKLMARAQ